jgi:predicted deacylase
MSQFIKVYNTIVEAGQNTIVKIPVGRIPSGNVISIKAHVYRGPRPGPCMSVTGGMHGDEVNGVEIVRRAIEQGVFENLYAGTVIAIPLLNVYGFINYSRDVSEGKDINRSFPGNPNGSMAARVASLFTRQILPLVDFGVDFHTGGRNHYNYPQIRYNLEHPLSRELALTFAAPFTVASKLIPKSLRKTALDANKAIIVFEGGENLRFDDFSIQQGINGLRRVMVNRGMLPDAPPASPTETLNNSTWMRANRSGIFRWIKCSGEPIVKGDIVGTINDPFGEDSYPVRAKKDGWIIGHSNSPVVTQGDALFHIGYNKRVK